MITRLKGILISNELDRIEIETPSGVVYEVEVPLTILQRIPAVGALLEIRTLYVVREDSATLYGFIDLTERSLFQRLLGATGVGPKLALAMLSALSAPRLARALADRDLAALTQVTGVGRKKAERIAMELWDKVDDLLIATTQEGPLSAETEAVRALVALGYTASEADDAVRQVVRPDKEVAAEELIRLALAVGR